MTTAKHPPTDFKAKTHALAHLATGLHLRWYAGRRSHSGPEHRIRRRRIPHWNVIVVEDGELWVRLGQTPQRTVSPGQGTLIAPGLEHDVGMRTTGIVRWADFDLLIWGAVPLPHLLHLQQWLTSGVCAPIGDLIVKLNHINARGFDTGMDDVRKFLVHQVEFIDLLLTGASFAAQAPDRLLATQRIDKVLAAICAVPGRPWSRDELCDMANMAPTRLTAVFKEATGLTPVQFVANRRIEHAANVLLTSDRTCADIAESCGFFDTYHFSRRFKKHFGISPSSYRTRGR
jgi:AraC-like DNA-binding protein